MITSTTRYFLSRPIFVATVSCTFIIIFVFLILKPKTYLQSKQDVESYINNWNYEITHNLYMEDITKNPSKIDYIKKLMDPLKFYPLSFYEIIIDKKTIL